jgi:ribonuclease HI
MRHYDVYIQIFMKKGRESGAWSFCLVDDDGKKDFYYAVEYKSTIVTLQLGALCTVLSMFDEPVSLTIYEKSYLIDGMYNKGWYLKWKKMDFYRKITHKGRIEIENVDVIKKIGRYSQYHKVEFIRPDDTLLGIWADLKLKGCEVLLHGLQPRRPKSQVKKLCDNMGENLVIYNNFKEKEDKKSSMIDPNKNFFQQRLLLTV